jgi:hypothetical protein
MTTLAWILTSVTWASPAPAPAASPDSAEPDGKADRLPEQPDAQPDAQSDAQPDGGAPDDGGGTPAPEATPADPREPAAPPGAAPDPGPATLVDTEGQPLVSPFAEYDAEPRSAPEPTQSPIAPPPSPRRELAPRPIRWRLDLAVGLGGTLVLDPGYLAFRSDRNLLGFDAGLRWDHRVGQRLFLGAGVAYRRFATSRNPYAATFSTDLVVHEPTIYGRVSVSLVEGIDLFADLGGGPTIVLDEISATYRAAKRRRTAIGAFSAMGGVAVYLPKQWLKNKQAARVTGGLETGFGYQFRGGLDMATDLDLDEDPLTTNTASFGDLALRGFVWRMGVFLRIM